MTSMSSVRQLRASSTTAFRHVSTLPRTPSRATSLVPVSKTQGKDAQSAGCAIVTTTFVVTQPLPAFASPTAEFAQELQSKLDAAASLTEKVTSSSSEVTKFAKDAVDAAKPVLDYASPIVKKAADDALNTATPVIKEGTGAVGKAVSTTLKSSGLDLDAVASAGKVATDAASTAVTTAAPVAQSVFKVMTSSDPSTLATFAGGAAVLVFLSPVWGPALASSIRGYAGDISAASALDLVTQSNVMMVDLRSAEEIAAKGSPLLPRGASKLSLVPVATIMDKRLRGQMSRAASVEVESTAIVIAALKRVTKGTTVLLLDRKGSTSKQVARCLSRLGFKKVFVIDGGFEGRGGWIQSSLARTAPAGIQSTSGSIKILGTQFGSTGRKALGSGSVQQQQKQLPQ
eukprot:CAMPEP_0118957528 /NCGR_PEP_ID=MMETSP1169-20130426/62150_1 /TAXON_ID=36882 /ORGANISM="Pyramimonas obovata, Strain CCMP722" /LENGTH=400 /DNA_ID=CAMNT_0006905615 /DNA_START=31 /DNA_END=1233 /DNA_ORIENTATION=+